MTTNIAPEGYYRVNFWTIDWDGTDLIDFVDYATIEEVKAFLEDTKLTIDGIYNDKGQALSKMYFGIEPKIK